MNIRIICGFMLATLLSVGAFIVTADAWGGANPKSEATIQGCTCESGLPVGTARGRFDLRARAKITSHFHDGLIV